MVGFEIQDWDDAYENRGNIAGSTEIAEAWGNKAKAFRDQAKSELDVTTEENSSIRYDIFWPTDKPKGMFVFVHGGYWQVTDKSTWSHLAKGAVEAGWAVVIPGYDLCPKVSIGDIINMVAASINHVAKKIAGPIVLTGHSAGGHLVATMRATDTQLEKNVSDRVKHVVPISGLCDLRPLLKTQINDALQLDWQAASALSPVLQNPLPNTRLTAWVGGNERSEFLRQNRLLADMWHGLGANTQIIEEPDKHHFSVIDGLEDQNSVLMKTILNNI